MRTRNLSHISISAIFRKSSTASIASFLDSLSLQFLHLYEYIQDAYYFYSPCCDTCGVKELVISSGPVFPAQELESGV